MNDAEDRFYIHTKKTFLRWTFIKRSSEVYHIREKSNHPKGLKRRIYHQGRKPS